MTKGIFTSMIFTLLTLLVACKQELWKKKDTVKFKKTIKLSGDKIHLDNLKSPIDICVIPEQNLLLLADRDDYFIKVYSLNNLKYVKSFSKKGVDRNQQIICTGIQYDYKKNVLYSVDSYKKKIFIYTIKDILSSSTTPTNPTDSISLITDNLDRPIVLNTGNVIDFQTNYRNSVFNVLSFYKQSGVYWKSVGDYPNSNNEFSNLEVNFAYSGSLNLSNDGKNVISSFLYTDFVDIYDTVGNLKKRFHGPDFFDPKCKSMKVAGATYNVTTKDTRKAYIGKARMNGNELFLIYDGRLAPNQSASTVLLNYDSNFKPKMKMHLSDAIYGFDLDWKTNEIYALGGDFERGIIKFSLK